jgi:hypothetical protein
MRAPIASTRTIELRKSCRYRLSAPVFFCWATPDTQLQSSEGVTRDIDTTGAYIKALQLPPVGALVQLDIMLPSLVDGGPGAHLTGEGVVLRVEPHNCRMPSVSESGFAVSVQFYLQSSESILSHLRSSGRVM